MFEPPVVQAARLRDVDWLCSSCRERGFRPVQVAVRDGLCGWCWLTASKNGAA